MSKQIITVTDNAKKRISSLLEKRGKESFGIKVGINTKGCSGLSYTIEYADQKNPFDEEVDYLDDNGNRIKILIDPKAVMYIIGSQMDFVEEKMKSGFVFSNPNEKGKCGCGESFHV